MHFTLLNFSDFQFHQPLNTLPAYPADPQVVTQMAVMQQMYAQYMSQYWQRYFFPLHIIYFLLK